MTGRIARLIAFACVFLAGIEQAASGDGTGPIATDRPALTDSSVVVPAGSIQFENGFSDTVSHGLETVDGPETLLRFGMLVKTELRVDVPDYFSAIGGAPGVPSGFGDLGIGVKQQLGPAAGFDASLVLSLSVPTGANGISSGGYDPSIQLPWSRSLSTNWTAAGMLSVYWPTEGQARRITGEATFLIDRQLTKTVDAFVEYAGDFPERGSPGHLLHAGAAYKPTPHQQLDVHAGVGLSPATVDHFIGIGYSFRFALFRR